MKKIKNPSQAAPIPMIHINRMSSDYINSLPIIHFQGKVIVINHREQANGFLKRLKREKYIGFDTESRPSFSKGISYPPSIIQLATQDTAYLIQLEKTSIFDELVDLFSNARFKKIGIGTQNDIEKLQEIRKFSARGFIDLSKIAAQKGIIQVGARALTARYMEHRLTKSSQKSNWAVAQLTQKQMEYAATDAWICLKIYPLLLSDSTDYSQLDSELIDS
jgi:ribonuclease D